MAYWRQCSLSWSERRNGVNKKGKNGGKGLLLKGRAYAMAGRHEAAGSGGKLSLVPHIWTWDSGRVLGDRT